MLLSPKIPFFFALTHLEMVQFSEPPALSVSNEYLTHSSPYNTMPALNLIDDEVVRPDRSPYEYVLEHPQVRVRDWAMVEKKLEQMVSGGREKLMVIFFSLRVTVI